MTILENKQFGINNSPDQFEYKLERLLSPRQANPEFVQSLKHKLLAQPNITVEARKQYMAFWVLAAGLFAGAMAFFLLSKKSKQQPDSE
jgi:hypothetical protein